MKSYIQVAAATNNGLEVKITMRHIEDSHTEIVSVRCTDTQIELNYSNSETQNLLKQKDTYFFDEYA